ncbi:MAG: site-specific DNA-methyltransferase [Methylobacter sp.]
MPTLTWVGKDKVVNHHHDVPFRVLKKQYTFAAQGGCNPPLQETPASPINNRIIHGDNLEALKSLLPEFEGKVKCIYIDPPYNTGNEGWVYNDNVNDPRIKRWLGHVVGKEGEDLSRHDKWLCMMYPRLKLLHRLLADDGLIFISIDDNEQANLKLVMNEIFGQAQFVSQVIWQKKFSPQNDAKHFDADTEYVLCYAKKLSKLNLNLLRRTREMDARYKNLDNDSRGVWTAGDSLRKEYREYAYYSIRTPSGRDVFPPPGSSWRFNKEELPRLLAENKLYFGKDGNGVPRIKRFLSDVKDGIVPQTLWKHDEVGNTQEAKKEIIAINKDNIFDTPKPTRLMERILQIASDKNSIILDSFAGSGTTAHAVLKLNAQDGGNRRFILVEMMDYAETITAERVRRVMNGYGEGNNAVSGLGGSFDYYTIGEPIFLPDDNLNEAVGVNVIRDYVAYTEGIKARYRTAQDNAYSPYLLGLNRDNAWLFYYEPDQVTVLDLDFLASLKFGAAKPGTAIIYADRCLLDKAFMIRHGIFFKKIPRNITRF